MRTAGFGESAWTPTRGVLPIRSRIDSYLISLVALHCRRRKLRLCGDGRQSRRPRGRKLRLPCRWCGRPPAPRSHAPAPVPVVGRAAIAAATGLGRLSPGDGGKDGDDVAVGHLGLELV